MYRYIIKKLLALIPILFVLSFIVFLTMYLAPGDIASKMLNSGGIVVEKEVLENVRESLGLKRSFISQYFSWISAILQGDFGNSLRDGKPVIDKILIASSYTIILALSSLFLAIIISIPLGIFSAIYKNSFLDHIIKLFSFISNALPNFLISVLLIYFFAIQIKIFPVIAKGSIQGLALPSISLALPLAGRFIRQIRAEMLSELDKAYVNGLKQRGLKNSLIIYRNVFHNCLASIITIVALSLGTLLGGSVVTETIFNWQGLGYLVMSAITNRDYMVIQAFVLVISIFYVVLNLLTDIFYHILDPRIELS